MIKDAINYILETVVEPALLNKILADKYKNKLKSSRTFLLQFKKTGDLYHYLLRFQPIDKEDMMYNALKKLDLITFEDILPNFKRHFISEFNDITTLSDFIPGEIYTAFDISIFSKQYNNQPGIYLINDNSQRAIFIKATFENGNYANRWLTDNKDELKYYMNSHLEIFDPNYKVNRAIIESKEVPIYVFEKQARNTYHLEGIYKYIKFNVEHNNAKWFHLKRREMNNLVLEENEFNNLFNEGIKEALELTSMARIQKIKEVDPNPQRITSTVTSYRRNPFVAAETLIRAKGICEICHNPAPFIKAIDNTPYLEIHHKIHLSKGGLDNLENTIAICPNCHRREHFGCK